MLWAAGFVSPALTGFGLIAHEVVLEREDIFDTATFRFLHGHVQVAGNGVPKFLTFFGSMLFLPPAYIVTVAACLLLRRWRMALDISIIGSTGMGLLTVLKHAFHRSRPDSPLLGAAFGYSFPSGHAMSFFVFCAMLIYLIRQGRWPVWTKWVTSLLLLAFSLAVGLSRIVLRVHYASDVPGGLFMGFAWVTLLLTVQEQLRRKRERKSGQ